MTDDNLTDADLTRGLQDFVASRIDLDKLPQLIASAIRAAPDPERCASMLRRGASPLVNPQSGGTISVALGYGAGAEILAAVRAAVWSTDAEEPPAVGDPERDEVMVLGEFAVSALASLPTG
jgi:hypothetical protein